MNTEQDEIPAPTSEYLEFLVEHFKNLAKAKDDVIIQYIELLERYKPCYERQKELQQQLLRASWEIESLKKQVSDFKKKITKASKDE